MTNGNGEIGQTEIVNYTEEAAKLKEHSGTEYFKAQEGSYKVVPLGEMEAYEHLFEGDDKPTRRVRFDAEITPKGGKAEKKVYSANRNDSQHSHYGQLIRWAKANNNTLVGKPFTLIVTGQGKQTKYTIVEVAGL